jgi:hypothetical protein
MDGLYISYLKLEMRHKLCRNEIGQLLVIVHANCLFWIFARSNRVGLPKRKSDETSQGNSFMRQFP